MSSTAALVNPDTSDWAKVRPLTIHFVPSRNTPSRCSSARVLLLLVYLVLPLGHIIHTERDDVDSFAPPAGSAASGYSDEP